MVDTLRHHWQLEQRVRALKVVIQLSKLLADTSQMKLYPRKYKLITEALDEFGRLVHIRIHTLATLSANGDGAANKSSQLVRQNDTNDHQPPPDDLHNELLNARELAKDTCRNWFLKVASIRELVPRYYTELAILKACDILLKSHSTIVDSIEEQFFSQSLKRLTKAAWGFGDPIVALHARAYLCKVAEKLIGWQGQSRQAILFELISMNLQYCATLVHYLDTDSILKVVQDQNVDIGAYLDLVSSPIQSILNLVTIRCDVYNEECSLVEKVFEEKLGSMLKCLLDEVHKDKCCTLARNIILYSAFKALPSDLVAEHAEELLDALRLSHQVWKELRTSDINAQLIMSTFYSVLNSFMIALDGSDSFESKPDIQMKILLLHSADDMIEELFKEERNCAEYTISVNYLRCFKSIISYANHYIDKGNDVETLLARFVARMENGRQYANHYQVLIDIIKTFITNKTTLEGLKRIFSSKSFGQLLDLLRKDEQRLDASKWILETMRANIKLNYKGSLVEISDKVTINFTLKLFSTINDSLSVLMALDDFEHLAHLVIFFLDKITIENFEERLDFLSRCRSSMGNLNIALEYLTQKVLKLPDQYRKVEKKRRLRQNFLNGCLAFAFISIPAINNPSSQLQLFIEGGQLALSQMSLSLADYYMKQVMESLIEQTRSYETRINEFNLLSHNVTSENDTRTKTDTATNRSMSKQLINHATSVLEIMIKYQDHIDLRHKLALADLIKNSYSGCSNLLQSLKLLNCIDDTGDIEYCYNAETG